MTFVKTKQNMHERYIVERKPQNNIICSFHFHIFDGMLRYYWGPVIFQVIW